MATRAPELRTTPAHRPGWLDLVCLAALAVVCVRRFAGLEAVLDLPSWDEADYLRAGLRLHLGESLPSPEWGPLYALWYAGLATLEADPVRLFHLSYRLLVLVPTLALYLAARRVGAPAAVAFGGAFLFAWSPAAEVLPRPALLALAVLLVGFVAAVRARRPDVFALVVALATLLASYARPELSVGFVLASGAWLVALVRQAGRPGGGVAVPGVQVAAWAGALVVLGAVLGHPLDDRTNRRRYAFCQHFALGEVNRAGLSLEPWAQCEAVLRSAFGEVDGVVGAVRANPSAFLRHVGENAQRYPRASVALFSPTRPLLGDDVAFSTHARRLGQTVMLAVVAGWLLARRVATDRMRHSVRRRAGRQDARRAGLLFAVVLVPTVLSSLLVHPRAHYLVAQGGIGLLFLVAWASGRSGGVRRGLVAAVVVSVGLAVAWSGASRSVVSVEVPRPNARVVETLRTLVAPHDGRRIRVVENQGGYHVWAGDRFERAYLSDRIQGEPFADFLRREGVDVIVIEPRLVGHHALAADPGFAAFVADPASLGFREVAVAGTERRLLVRAPLVPTDPEARLDARPR